jgi:septum site-determining protein MinC
MMLLRGKGQGLEIGCFDRDVASVCIDLRSRLDAQPDFYRGSKARAIFGPVLPSEPELAMLRDLLAEFEIVLADVVLGEAPVREAQPKLREVAAPISESARSLVADFAGARADLAARRIKRGRSAHSPRMEVVPDPAQAPAVAAAPEGATLYHRGTLRGGQALHHLGNIVVVGDVNPGAELVASGDIVVFGALRGVAHAGAQGDESARVVALDLAPTQLRIATIIAAGDEKTQSASAAEHAIVQDGRIVIVPHERADTIGRASTERT